MTSLIYFKWGIAPNAPSGRYVVVKMTQDEGSSVAPESHQWSPKG